jgi:(p)ppGpp synthase/HD superfamily hydrolase
MSSQLIAAFDIARVAHANQKDKSGNPYIAHPVRVALACFPNHDAMVVALLHDVIEDTDYTLTEIYTCMKFGSHICEAIHAITKCDDEDQETYLARVKTNALATQVKLADIEDNLDPRRLMQLPEKVQARLVKKYHAAQQYLAVAPRKEAQPPPPPKA